jgi:hypothetical protein
MSVRIRVNPRLILVRHDFTAHSEAAVMRFTVHADQHSGPVEFQFASAIEAISKAWQQVSAGANGLYIYDDEKDEAFWPDRFADLHR